MSCSFPHSACALGALDALVVGGLTGTTVVRAQAGTPAGQAPYDRVCKVCHGPEGKGSAAPAMVPFDEENHDLLKATDLELNFWQLPR